MRSIYCGDVGAKEEGQEVTVAGWSTEGETMAALYLLILRS